MAVLEPYRGDYYLWKYVPSKAAAAIFCVLFAIATMAHTWRIGKSRAWMAIPFAFGGFSESIPPIISLHLQTEYLLTLEYHGSGIRRIRGSSFCT